MKNSSLLFGLLGLEPLLRDDRTPCLQANRSSHRDDHTAGTRRQVATLLIF